MFWLEVHIYGPGVDRGVHPLAGVVVLHLLFGVLFLNQSVHVFVRDDLLRAAALRAGPLSGLRGREAGVARGADPQPLGGVNVSDHGSLLGARAADHEAAFPAVVSTLRQGELFGAAHADRGRPVGDPGVGEVGPGPADAAPQQTGPAFLDVLDPGALLL